MLIPLLLLAAATAAQPADQPAVPSRVMLVRAADIARPGPAPHEGKGPSTGYPISTTGGLARLYFVKRMLGVGGTIGRHVMDREEVYYVERGSALVSDDQGARIAEAGTTIVMKPGQTVEVAQRGTDELMLIVSGVRP